MGRFEVTISQPSGASPSIPAVILSDFGSEGYVPGAIVGAELAGFTQARKGIIQGSGQAELKTWTLGAKLPEFDLQRLNELIRWQNQEFSDQEDGRLVITDEFEYLIPEASPHSATLLSGSQITVRSGVVTGFGIFRCFVAKADGHGQHLGAASDGGLLKQCAIVVTEVPA